MREIRAVAATGFDHCRATGIGLVQNSVVNVSAESGVNCIGVGTPSVCRQLHAAREAFCKIMNEVISTSGVALPDKPAWDELSFCINRHPRPSICDESFAFITSSKSSVTTSKRRAASRPAISTAERAIASRYGSGACLRCAGDGEE